MAAAGEEIPVGRRQRKSSVISFRPFPFVGHRLASIFFLGGGVSSISRSFSRPQLPQPIAIAALPDECRSEIAIGPTTIDENNTRGKWDFWPKKKIRKMDFFSDASSATAFQRRVSFRGRVVFLVCFPFSFCEFFSFFFCLRKPRVAMSRETNAK